MDLSKILSIAGKPGLYRILNQSRGGVVATSLVDGKKISIGQTQRVSTLSDISIYKEEGDEPLANIFKTFYDKADGKELDVDTKDNDNLRSFFYEVLPEHDEERVYASDIKKMIKWYNLLIKNNLLDFSEEASESSKDQVNEDSENLQEADSAKTDSEEGQEPK